MRMGFLLSSMSWERNRNLLSIVCLWLFRVAFHKSEYFVIIGAEDVVAGDPSALSHVLLLTGGCCHRGQHQPL